MPTPEHTVLASRYFVTDGSKFGSEYLLYPGDPLLYHAQFTVQVLDNQAAIKPALLVGGARGSHSARKHLLLASVGCMQQRALTHTFISNASPCAGIGVCLAVSSECMSFVDVVLALWQHPHTLPKMTCCNLFVDWGWRRVIHHCWS